MPPPYLISPAPTLDAPAPIVLSRLTAALAHNVNNALTGVIGYLELALQRPGPAAPVDGYLHSGLDCAHQAAEAVRRIVRCTKRIAAAEAPTAWSLLALVNDASRRFSLERTNCKATMTGTSAGQVHASAEVIAFALDELLNALAALSGAGLALHVADEAGRCALYVESRGDVRLDDLQPRLLEASLLIELQDGSVEFLSRPGKPLAVSISFACRNEAPMRCDEAETFPAAPHQPAGRGLLRKAV